VSTLFPLNTTLLYTADTHPPQAAQELLQSFGPRNFLKRILRSSGDKAQFEEVHAQLNSQMVVSSFSVC
jgi:hypothetical protein